MPLPSSTAGPRSSFPNSVQRTTTNISSYFRTKSSNGSRQWRPPALHPATLAFAIAVPLALIITLVLLLRRSQRDDGIIFAPDINDLPLSRTFMYQYFPTILAVVFSIFWAWIDLEVKRLEPYYRLSADEGALGKDSLLLAYPFGFVPLVPVKAFRQKHWPVFWASLALLLVTWGLVPTQAGIFSIEHITRNITDVFEVTTGYMPPNEQKHSLGMNFALSAYGIVALNETLPPFMARNYTLAPFKPSTIERQASKDLETQEWTAPTTLYSLDMHCEPGIPFENSGIRGWNNSGCVVSGLPMGNETITASSVASTIKPFSSQYIGFWNLYGFADYYLSTDCPIERNHTFFAAFTRNKEKESDPAQNITAIFCEPTYYSQLVNATVRKSNNQPIRIVPLEQKQPLNDTHAVLNTTVLEMLFSGGNPQTYTRLDELPNTNIPSLAEQLAETNVSFASDREPLVGFSILIDETPLEDFLDWEVLSRSYTESYRLMFARAMVDVLGGKFNTTKSVAGTRRMETSAVVLEPIFTFIVIGFLSLIALLTMVLFCLSRSRNLNLHSDPSTIGSVMTLVTDSGTLLQDFEDLDCCTVEELEQAIQKKRYKLLEHDNQVNLVERRGDAGTSSLATVATVAPRTVSAKTIDKPVRPVEFSIWMCSIFVTVFLALAIFLATVFVKARSNGLPLPSQDKFVQNLLENYIPTAIATLIEPLWVLINRLLCLLQPIEELQNCKAKAKDSVDLNYNSLPPQLVLFKALRARHFVLATVCSMALLANVLSIAFAGLFHHDVAEVFKTASFEPPFDLRFVQIDGRVGPSAMRSSGLTQDTSGAYLGGDGRDQFYIRNSNLSRQTPLPSWTDEKAFYLPFMTAKGSNDTDDGHFQSETAAVSAKLECDSIDSKGVHFSPGTSTPILNTTVQRGNVQVQCSGSGSIRVIPGPGLDDTTFDTKCQSGETALELVITLDALGANATELDKKLCRETVLLGWLRSPTGTCNSFSDTPTVNAQNSLFVQCRPQLMRGLASVRVDSQGRLVNPSHTITPAKSPESSESDTMFEHGPEDLIAQSNLYIFQSNFPPWHNDTIASDCFNYFVKEEANDNRFLDPRSPVPSFEELYEPIQKAYASLFAIWLGVNKEHLLIRHSNTEHASVKGWRVVNEERLFLSTTLSGIALGILCTYALVACMVYLRRPGKYLARLPTNLASIIALFAGSTAVQAMRGMSGLSRKERANSFAKLEFRYGYGSYVGTDGRVHIGIEKTPFVRPWKKTFT